MGLDSAPKAVKNAFGDLKRTTGKKLSLHMISGKYYVYEYSYDKLDKAKSGVRTKYIGHITEDGRYVAKGEKTTTVAHEQKTENGQHDEREAIALRNLSMNGRMSMAKLAKRIGMSVTGTGHFIKSMEKKYRMKYFAEVDTMKLGYLRYIALIKFEDKIPKIDEIKKAFEKDYHVAFVAMINGIYDMMIIFHLESTTLLTNFIYDWRSSKALSDYEARWYITPFGIASGITIPLRAEFADNIANGNDRKSSIECPVILTDIERLVLNELIVNGIQEFSSIDTRYGLGAGRSNYAFYKLKEKGVIERITITINPLGLRYNSIFITQTNNYKRFVENQYKWFQEVLSFDKNQLLNKDTLRGDIGVPDSILHIRPIFDEKSFYETKEKLDLIEGTKTTSMIITDLVIGSLCYRNFDPMYTKLYERLVKQNKMQNKNKVEY